jgi:GT2 family glycosyltransferase/glycosyltransferase involved in cell wall biosynthesis
MVGPLVRQVGRSARGLLVGRSVAARVVLVDRPTTPTANDKTERTAPSEPISKPVAAPQRAVPIPVDARSRAITVFVPVYNAYGDLVRCVDSVRRNTTRPVTLLLIDDASTDARIAPYLASLAESNQHVVAERNVANLGFVRTVNAGFAMRPDDDVIILNSDTEVPPRWVESMSLAAADPNVATVTAFSNNAGAFSAPVAGEFNALPSSIDDVGRAVAQFSQRIRPEVPTGNGFCMFIKREVIDQLGGFDAENFGRGYCEENDFCMRARAAGWRNVVDDSVLVAHHGSASFGEDKAALLAANRARLDELHPDYNDAVRGLLSDTRMAAARERVAAAIDHLRHRRPIRPRVLYVLHAGGGGTPQTNGDLMAGVSKRFDPILLRSTGTELILTDGVDGRELERIPLPTALGPTTFTDPSYASIVRRLLVELSIELVHVRHLQGHTHDLPKIAADLHIPVIISLHDYYFVCPTVQLLDNEDRYCAGTCTDGQGVCRTPPGLADTPHLKHGYVNEWRRHSAVVLAAADAYVTTSSSAADVLTTNFPDLAPRLRVIEHGRDLEQIESVAAQPVSGEPIRILVPGTLGIHKGARLIQKIAELDTDERLEFHLIGKLTREARIPRLVDHGPYERHEFAQLAAEIRPAATAVLSIWAETYSHTVTESWSVGVPVLGSNWGAVNERIERHGGGWSIDTTDARIAFESIIDALTDGPEWERQRALATTKGLPSTLYMSSRYMDLYADVMDQRRVLAARLDPVDSQPSDSENDDG